LHFNYSELFIKTADTLNKKTDILIVGIFYPSGKPTLPQLHRCSPFAVVHYSFMGRFLALAAILTCE